MQLVKEISTLKQELTKTFTKPAQTKISSFGNIYIGKPTLEVVQEQFKGIIDQKPTMGVSSDIGEEHPFNFQMGEEIYKKVPYVHGIINKLVDFILGNGFYVICDDERAKQIATDFLEQTQFDSLLRQVIKDALITGNGFLEISGKLTEPPTQMKCLSSKNMYVRMNEYGDLLGYTQYRGLINKKIFFEPHEIAHFTHNKIGDSPYGIGTILPVMGILDQRIKAEKDLHMLLQRKANAPLHVKIGLPDKDFVPNPDDVTAFGQKLEWMNNKHEWVTDAFVDMKVLDFGNFGEKFDLLLRYDENQLFYAFQAPEVLMGRSGVREAIADVQLDTFLMRVSSIQAELEKVIEESILKRLLNAHGLDVHVEFEWGVKNDKKKFEEIARITELLKTGLSAEFRTALEERIAELMELEVKLLPEEEREFELEQPQPQIPGQSAKQIKQSFHKIITNNPYDKTEYYMQEIDDNVTVEAWIGYSYKDYKEHIKNFVSEYGFDFISATSKVGTKNYAKQVTAGLLTKKQTEKLRNVLITGIDDNSTMREIASSIKETVKPKAFVIPAKVNAEGDIVQDAYEIDRSEAIARTEVIRASNAGALKQFTESGTEKVRWVAALSERTCDLCEEKNGMIFEAAEVNEDTIPLHPSCRCSWVAVTKFDQG